MNHDSDPLADLATNRRGTARGGEAACVSAVLGTITAALCLIAIVWSVYAAFDHKLFDFQEAVLRPAIDVGNEVVTVAHSRDASRAVR